MSISILHTDTYTEPDDVLEARVAWASGVERVWFVRDGVEIASWTEADGQTCSEGCPDKCRTVTEDWDTTRLAEGEHTLEVFLLDASGRQVSDSEVLTVVHDVDGDGHEHEGYSGDDCDDRDDDVHPGAAETCDDKDNDCDGLVDEDFDTDGDGFPAGPTCPDRDWVDCDDTDPDVNPGATEVCGDGTDNDCDGPDDACLLLGEMDIEDVAWASFDGETAYDRVGLLLERVGDVDGDGIPDLLVGSSHVDTARDDSGYSGGVYVVSGATGPGSHSLGDAMARIEGTYSETWFGYAATGIGDVDHDGYADFAVSEPYSGLTSVYMFHGPLSGALNPSAAEDTIVAHWSTYGASLAAGDLDGDGDTDLAVGACLLTIYGGVSIIYGPLTTTRSTTDVHLADLNLRGSGCEMAMAPDTDGDGRDDLLIGAPLDDTLAEDAGGVWLITDLPSSNTDLEDANEAFIRGRTEGAQVGWEVSGAGDTDGDGYGDVLIGTWLYDEASDGHAWLHLGPLTGDLSTYSADTEFESDDGGEMGAYLVGLDIDGDGLSDVAISTPTSASGSSGGYVSLFYGPVPSGTLHLPDDADATIADDEPGGWFGSGMQGAGDVDGDGCDDLFVGASWAGTDLAGRAFLVLGQWGD